MNKRIKTFLFLLLLIIPLTRSSAQSDSSAARNIKLVNIGLGTAYAGTMTGLYGLWYKDYPLEGFHFFNDNNEWLQMDKCGHFFSSYQVGRAGMAVYNWAGMTDKKAIWRGGMLGSVFLTTVEIMDGFSSNWGASWGDLLANTSGSALFIGQQLAWGEQRIQVKYSFHTSPYASVRPNLLGSDFPEQVMKDYNGQTYWLSCNLNSIIFPKSNKLPKWLTLDLGYSGEGMVGANSNLYPLQSIKQLGYPDNLRMRQWYLAPGVDLTKIRTKSKTLKTVFFLFNCIRLPAPALELNKHGLKFHSIYF